MATTPSLYDSDTGGVHMHTCPVRPPAMCCRSIVRMVCDDEYGGDIWEMPIGAKILWESKGVSLRKMQQVMDFRNRILMRFDTNLPKPVIPVSPKTMVLPTDQVPKVALPASGRPNLARLTAHNRDGSVAARRLPAAVRPGP